ncbi:MAG: CHAT domain-containing protein [Acidobacteriaceae bacterium]|nr:CHAT domain-containing protein [Acidobacteriaceae bacterium]
MPPLNSRKRSLVGRLLKAVCALNVLCGLLHAGQTQQNSAVLKQIDAVIDEGRKLRMAGNSGPALEKLTAAAHLAHSVGDLDRESIALRESSTCNLFLFQYREALSLAQASRTLAIQAKDETAAGAAAMILCAIYIRLGDLPLAEKESKEEIRLLANSPRKDFYAKALLNQALLDKQAGRSVEGAQWARRAVDAARQANLKPVEGLAWDALGLLLLNAKQLADSENALNTSVSIQRSLKDTDNIAVTYEHLAELNLAKNNYSSALNFIDQAFSAHSPFFKTNAQYYPVHVRAQILLGLGRTREALLEFRRAVDLATEWRAGALPGDVTSTSTVAQLHDVYQDYAEFAATLALKDHDSALLRQGLEAIAENRAASLREQLARSLDENLILPPEYFKLVSALQKEQAGVTLGEKPQDHEAKLREIRLQLSDLENRIGLKPLDNSPRLENNSRRNSLRSIQARLSTTEVLLSFCLGKRKSFVWAVTGESVNLYELPDETVIGNQAKAFTSAVRENRDFLAPGRDLSQTLLGKLSTRLWNKHDWLITADGALLDGVPFSALPVGGENGSLSASHSVRLLPSELLLLQPTPPKPAPMFVGVADPVYNLADARRSDALPLVKANHAGSATVLARLAGSGREVKAAADSSGLANADLLTGPRATGDALRHATVQRPEVVHFAVHVVSPEARPEEAALALSLTPDGMPELLTPEAIATYRVPGSLVVMSGCDSEQGKMLPSAGLVGLSRAWLLAGAAAVVVSAWPTPDDSGKFFSSFYAHFQQHSGPLPKRAAAALAEAQLDMQRGVGYRSSPSLWAAYSIISKE